MIKAIDGGNCGETAAPLRTTTVYELMWAYDQLPWPIRQALANAKFDIDPIELLGIYRSRQRGANIANLVMAIRRLEQHIHNTDLGPVWGGGYHGEP